MADAYTSCPVDRLTHEFRLLRIQPAEGDEDIIKCDMQTYSPWPRPSYTALSYTWGNKRTAVLETIEINGVRFPVRENLRDFLRQQQRHENYGPFWIDAICIQQSNVHERNHQVQMMRFLFSDARSVLVWLGKEGDDSDLAMQMLNTIDPPQLSTDQNKGMRESAKQLKSVATWSNKQLHSISSLCKRRYWSRMWIIQEILIARDIEIQCGSKILEWNKLEHLYHYILTMSGLPAGLCSGLHKTINTSPAMSIVSTKRGPRERVDLKPLLQTFGTHNCEDIRDKVYALAGVATYGAHIVIDYRKSAKDVLLDAFYHEMKRVGWEDRQDTNSVINFGRLLEKIFQVHFPVTEIRFHMTRTQLLISEKLRKGYPRPSEEDFYRNIGPPQEESLYLNQPEPKDMLSPETPYV